MYYSLHRVGILLCEVRTLVTALRVSHNHRPFPEGANMSLTSSLGIRHQTGTPLTIMVGLDSHVLRTSRAHVFHCEGPWTSWRGSGPTMSVHWIGVTYGDNMKKTSSGYPDCLAILHIAVVNISFCILLYIYVLI